MKLHHHLYKIIGARIQNNSGFEDVTNYMAPALYIIPRVVAAPYNQTYGFLGESAWDVTHSLVYMKSTSSLTLFIPGFHHPRSLSQIYGKKLNFQSFLNLGMVNKRLCITLIYAHTHTYTYISKELHMRSMTAESFTFFLNICLNWNKPYYSGYFCSHKKKE